MTNIVRRSVDVVKPTHTTEKVEVVEVLDQAFDHFAKAFGMYGVMPEDEPTPVSQPKSLPNHSDG